MTLYATRSLVDRNKAILQPYDEKKSNVSLINEEICQNFRHMRKLWQSFRSQPQVIADKKKKLLPSSAIVGKWTRLQAGCSLAEATHTNAHPRLT